MSNPHTIARTSDFNPSSVSFGEIKKTEHGGLQIRVTNKVGDNTSPNITFQTPKMRVPFGASSSKMEGDTTEKYYIEFSFDEGRELVEKAHAKFKELDEHMLKAGMENSQKWFAKKKMSRELAEDKYSACIRRYKDPKTKEHTGKYPDTFRVKIPKSNEGAPIVEVYDQNNQRIQVETMEELMELVPKGCYVKAIIQCSNLWVTQKYGMGWRVVQLKIYPSGQISSYSFRDEDEEEF